MSTNWASLRAAINTKLNTLVGSGQPLAQVKSDHDENFTGFPAVTFEPSNLENVFYTTTENLRSYGFDIIVWQEMEAGGRNNAVTVLINAVDAIIAAFDTDYNLGGACDFAQPMPSSFGTVVIGNASFLYAKIVYVCKKEIDPANN